MIYRDTNTSENTNTNSNANAKTKTTNLVYNGILLLLITRLSEEVVQCVVHHLLSHSHLPQQQNCHLVKTSYKKNIQNFKCSLPSCLLPRNLAYSSPPGYNGRSATLAKHSHLLRVIFFLTAMMIMIDMTDMIMDDD